MINGYKFIGYLTLVFAFSTSCGDEEDDAEPEKYSPSKTRTIYVTGDEGVAFTGAIGTDGSSSSIAGTTPKEFTFDDGDILSATIQKSKDDSAVLRVECYFGTIGGPKKTAETKVGFGVASVACSQSD